MVDLQEAKVLDKGKNQIGLASGYFVPAEDESSFGLDGSMFYKCGLGNSLEFGIRASWFMSGRMDLKYQFYKNRQETFFIASGFNLGISAFTLEEQLGNFMAQVPIYATYAPVDWLSFYGNAKYTYHTPAIGWDQGLHLFSYNTGLRVGKKFGLMVEINHAPFYNSFFQTPINFREISQIHGGMYLNF